MSPKFDEGRMAETSEESESSELPNTLSEIRQQYEKICLEEVSDGSNFKVSSSQRPNVRSSFFLS
jgi:hypothetical protein